MNVKGSYSESPSTFGPGYFSGLGVETMVLQDLFDYEMLSVDADAFSGLETLRSLTITNLGVKNFTG